MNIATRKPDRKPTHRSWAPLALSIVETFDNGDVMTEVDVLELIPQAKEGRKFDPSKVADEIIANHEREAAQGYYPPLELGHEGGSGEPAVGWLMGLRKVGTRLKASMRLLASFVIRVKAGEFKHVSPEVWWKWKDQEGNDVGAQILRVAVTNIPHQRGADGQPVAALTLSALTGSSEEPMALSPEDLAQVKAICEEVCKSMMDTMAAKEEEDPEKKKLPPFDEAKLSGLVDKAVTEAVAKIATGGNADVVALTAKVQADIKAAKDLMDGEITKLTATIGEKSKTIDAMVAADADRDALAAIQGWLDSGRCALSQLPADWKKSPAKAVADLGFSTLSAATKFYATVPANSVVPLSARQSADKGTAGDDADIDASLDRLPALVAQHGGDRVKAAAAFRKLSAIPAGE